jgi:hypothetical protein
MHRLQSMFQQRDDILAGHVAIEVHKRHKLRGNVCSDVTKDALGRNAHENGAPPACMQPSQPRPRNTVRVNSGKHISMHTHTSVVACVALTITHTRRSGSWRHSGSSSACQISEVVPWRLGPAPRAQTKESHRRQEEESISSAEAWSQRGAQRCPRGICGLARRSTWRSICAHAIGGRGSIGARRLW